MPEIVSNAAYATFINTFRRFAGLIEFDPHECQVAHVAERRQDQDSVD